MWWCGGERCRRPGRGPGDTKCHWVSHFCGAVEGASAAQAAARAHDICRDGELGGRHCVCPCSLHRQLRSQILGSSCSPDFSGAFSPPLAAAKSSPARPPSSLTPSRPRPRRASAPRWPTAETPAWTTAGRRGCPSRTAEPHSPRSMDAVPSIGLTAGACIVQGPGLPPAPAPGACRAALQSGAAQGPQFVAADPSLTVYLRFNIPGTGHNSRGGRPRPAHAAELPGPLHLHGHFGKLPRARISLLRPC